tara:strand:+ start:109 stop:999 length:891 start_codon:yes stop_codon:yes gene_type:complete
MKKLLYVFLIFTLACSSTDEANNEIINDNIIDLIIVTGLDDGIKESSGLVHFENTLITHNDSGGESKLFKINPNNGNIIRSINVNGSNNIDWEDIAKDDTSFYIGDFGNNSGNRTDLGIYKIALSDLSNNSQVDVNSEIISFKYATQNTFQPSLYMTNFDAEGLISYNEKLYVFTKNWLNKKTDIYEIPKSIGDFEVLKIDSIDVQGLITGADYNTLRNSIILIGYDSDSSFLIEMKNINGNQFSQSLINRYELNIPIGYSSQIEGVSFFNENIYISSEESFVGIAGIYKFKISDL